MYNKVVYICMCVTIFRNRLEQINCVATYWRSFRCSNWNFNGLIESIVAWFHSYSNNYGEGEWSVKASSINKLNEPCRKRIIQNVWNCAITKIKEKSKCQLLFLFIFFSKFLFRFGNLKLKRNRIIYPCFTFIKILYFNNFKIFALWERYL